MHDDAPPHPSILDALNPAQREAAAIIDGPLCVLAGAGTGKTRTITHRIAWMITQGVPGSAILAMTFTNKAAREMRERVWSLTGRPEVRLTTFHSFCAAFLREEFPSIGRSSDFTIYDDADSMALVKRVIDEVGLDPGFHKPRAVLSQIGRWKAVLRLPEEALAEETGAIEHEVAKAYVAYDAALEEANACSFDDLLIRALLLLRDNDEVRERWARRITHVLVDEFQDTNKVQYALAKLLTAKTRNLCVTGDQDQSIYAWRGANPENFDIFLNDHPEAPVTRLEQNYRSTEFILAAASRSIAHNRFRIPKKLWTDAEAGEPVRVVGFDDDYSEAEQIAKAVTEFQAEGYRPESMAVFFRTNALSLPVERALMQHGLPYVMVGGLEFFARQEVKDLLAYLRFLANPRDVVSLSRVLNVPPRGIGQKTRELVIQVARSAGLPLGEVLRTPDLFADFPTRARTALTTFSAVLRSLDEHSGEDLERFIERVLEVTGYAEYWKQKSKQSGSLDPYQNIGQLVSLAKNFAKAHDEASLSDFLAQTTLLTDHDRTAQREGAVSLMTLHTSKGLEFDCVFMIGCEKGLLPHVMSLDSPEGEEEERRLFHVGMTRARKRLVLTYASARTRFGKIAASAPSSFLDEIGEDGVERFDTDTKHYGRSARHSGGAGGDHWEADPEGPDPFELEENPLAYLKAGAPVWNNDFGRGIVIALRGRGNGLDRKVVIEFENSGRRTLILRHANLEILEDESF